jgi:hypothetical protein
MYTAELAIPHLAVRRQTTLYLPKLFSPFNMLLSRMPQIGPYTATLHLCQPDPLTTRNSFQKHQDMWLIGDCPLELSIRPAFPKLTGTQHREVSH